MDNRALPHSYWDDYQSKFVLQQAQPSDQPGQGPTLHSAYEAQEAAILKILKEIYGPSRAPKAPRVYSDHVLFRRILEVGPGFGRITNLVMDQWPAFRHRAPSKGDALPYYALDVTEKGLDVCEEATQRPFTRRLVASIADPLLVEPNRLSFGGPPISPAPIGTVDLVLAIEVLLHVPPKEVDVAVYNLLAAAAYGAIPSGRPVSRVVTCDWTHHANDRSMTDAADFEARANVNGNWRHDYPALFLAAGARVISATRVGLQTIYVVQP